MVMVHLEYDIPSCGRSSMVDLGDVKILDSDLEIVSKDGSILHSNFHLMSKACPLLKSLLPTDKSVPTRIHLPDVSTDAILHLINVAIQGFPLDIAGNSIGMEVKAAARVLGFTEVSVLVYGDVREEEKMASSGQKLREDIIDEGEMENIEETQKEHPGEMFMETENSLHDINCSGKSFENDMEISETNRKMVQIQNCGIISTENSQQDVNGNMTNSCNDGIDVIKQNTSQKDESMLKVVRIEKRIKQIKEDIKDIIRRKDADDIIEPLKYQKKISELMVAALIKIETYEDKKETRKYLVNRIQTALDMVDTLIKEITKLTSNGGIISTENSLQDVIIPEPAENKIEIEEISYNNCEVKEAIIDKLKVEPTIGEDDTNDDNDHIDQISCGACHRVFSSASTLLVHSQKHMRGTRYFCSSDSSCTYAGRRTDMLKHLRTKHTGEKLFKCKACELRFSTCQKLRAHVKRIH